MRRVLGAGWLTVTLVVPLVAVVGAQVTRQTDVVFEGAHAQLTLEVATRRVRQLAVHAQLMHHLEHLAAYVTHVARRVCSRLKLPFQLS